MVINDPQEGILVLNVGRRLQLKADVTWVPDRGEMLYIRLYQCRTRQVGSGKN
jgi:hypothetical protein